MLCTKMSPIMVETFVEIYKEAITRSKGHRDNTVKIFKVLLEEVENWNNTIISTHAKKYEASCSYFSDLLAALFICYVNILSKSIRRKSDEYKNLEVQLPSNSDFVHSCLNNAAKDFEKKTQFFRIENEIERYDKLSTVCCDAIQKTLDDIVPYEKIFKMYLPDNSHFSVGDQEIVEPEPEIEEPQMEDPTPELEEPQMKTIPVNDNRNADVDLFPDAPIEQQKTEHTVNETVP